jgi:outer membrane protein, heavy metal efflux system
MHGQKRNRIDMNRIKLMIAGIVLFQGLQAQTGPDTLLNRVGRLNKSLLAQEQLTSSRVLEAKTGRAPIDPFMEYDYLYGSPASGGNQWDFALTQRFDFPTVYQRRKDLIGTQVGQMNLEQQVFRQEILLEAKLCILEVIYLNKRSAELQRRRVNAEKLVEDCSRKLERGDLTILDMNKAKLQKLNIAHLVALTESRRLTALTKLAGMYSGDLAAITDTIYPPSVMLPELEALDSTIHQQDPVLKMYEQGRVVQQQQIRLQKALNLPKVEAGYHSQGILGQRYHGFHLGLSLPLWENRNKLPAATARYQYADAAAYAHLQEHKTSIRQYYDQLTILRRNLSEQEAMLSTLRNRQLLNKALDYGQITVIQYFYEESFYFEAYDGFLLAEWEYQQAQARLFRFQL